MKQAKKVDSVNILFYIFLLLMAVAMIFPFFWMITSSFKTFQEINMIPSTLLPAVPTIVNYQKVNEAVHFMRVFGNSLFLAILKTSIVLYTSAIVGYVISKINFRYNNAVFLFVLTTMMIPWPVTIIPMYLEMVQLGWVGKYTSLVVPSLFSSFGIFMMKQFIDSIPNELIEAAHIDGSGDYGIFHRIILPNVGTAISALAIFQFLWVWDDFLWPTLMINRDILYTLPLALRSLQGQYFSDFGPIFAGATLSVIPVLIVYIVFQSRFVEGMAMAGIKG